MMQSQMGLSRLIDEVLSQTSDINNMVERMRIANRRLTGGTGQEPTPINKPTEGYATDKIQQEPPLMVRLSSAVELLNAARADLGSEITYFENLAETAAPPAEQKAYNTAGRN